MPKRNRHDIINDTEPTYTCAVCNTENDTHNGNAIEFYRLTGREEGKSTSLEICMECVEDFKSEVLAGDEDVDDKVLDTDTLPDGIFDRLEGWTHKAAVLTFTERENEVRSIQDVEQFFDALSGLLVWHPDSRFADYTNMEDTYESALAHDSSENGCHPDCRACADEEKHHQMFTDEEAIALDAVMSKCFEVVETCGPKGKDIYGYGMDALQRAGIAPESNEHHTATPQVAPIPAPDVPVPLPRYSKVNCILLAESESVLMFENREGLLKAIQYAHDEKNTCCRLTAWLRHVAKVPFIEIQGIVLFEVR